MLFSSRPNNISKNSKTSGYLRLYGTDEKFALEMKFLLALAYLPSEEIPMYFDEWRENISEEAKSISDWFSENCILIIFIMLFYITTKIQYKLLELV